MGYSAHVGSFNIDSSVTAGNDQSVTGVGFQPSIVMFWWSGSTATVDSVAGGTISFGFGAAISSSSRFALTGTSEDGQATTDSRTDAYNTECIRVMVDTGTIDGIADFKSLDADGFTLTIDDQFTADYRVSYLALGGTDLTNVYIGNTALPVVGGNWNITGVGFQPDAVLMCGSNIVSAASAAAGLAWGLGMATGASNEGTITAYSRDNQATTNTNGYGYNGECYALSLNNVVAVREEFVSFGADGFTLNHLEGDTAYYMHYICLKGGQYEVGDLTTRTDGNDIEENLAGSFEPVAVMFASANRALSTQDTMTSHARISIGAGTSTSNRAAQAISDESGLADTETAYTNQDDAVYAHVVDDAIEALMDIKSFDADGFTCVMDDTESSACWVTYLAIGAAATGTPSPSEQFAIPQITRGWNRSRPPDCDFELNTESPQAKGLVAWWPTIAGAGNLLRAYDRRAYISGILTNGASFIPTARYGKALSLDGDNDYVELGTIATGNALQLAGGPIAVSFWMYQVSGGDDYQRIIDKSTAGNGTNGWMISAHPTAISGGPRLDLAVAGLAPLRSNQGVYSLDTWQYIVVQGSGAAGGGQIFVSGTEVGLQTNNAFTIPSAQTNARIGTWNHADAREFKGYLADLRVYNRALTAAEIWQLYDPATRWDLYKPVVRRWTGWSEPDVAVPAGGPYLLTGGWKEPRPPDVPFELNTESPQAQGLVAWWPTLGSQGNVLRDYSQLGRHGAISGPTYTCSGQMGRVLSYSNNYVAGPSFNLGEYSELSICAWVCPSNTNDNKAIFSGDYTSPNFGVLLELDSNKIEWWSNVGVGSRSSSPISYAANNWLYICTTYVDSTRQTYHYFQGNAVGGGTTGGQLVSASMPQDLGVYNRTDKYWPGLIGDVRVYNRALTAAEVWSLYDPATRWELYKPIPPQHFYGGWSPAAIEEQEYPHDVNYDTVYYPRGWRRNRPPDLELELNTDSPLSKGLVAWWPTLMGRGAFPLRDHVGQYHMTAVNGPTWVMDGQRGPVVLFDDASSEYLAYSGAIRDSYPISVACFFNADDLSSVRILQAQSQGVAQNSDYYWALYITGGALRWRLRAVGDAYADATSAPTTNTWHHACGVSSASNDHAVYLDGGNKGTSTTNSPAVTHYVTGIGAMDLKFYGGFGSYFSGRIAEVAIWNAALTDAEVYRLWAPETRWELYRPVLKLAGGRREIVTLEEAAEFYPWLYQVIRPGHSDRPIHQLQL